MINDAWTRAAFFFIAVVILQTAMAGLNVSRETKRRWQHAITGHAFIMISYLIPIYQGIAALAVGAAGIYYMQQYHNRTYLRLFGPLLRPEEKQYGRLPGAFYFSVGTALTIALFPIQIARYAVECLALADPMAAWVGQSFGSPHIHRSATVAGCMGCFATAYAIGWYYLADSVSLHHITVGALVCCFVEALPLGNDNLLIPLATAAAVQYAK